MSSMKECKQRAWNPPDPDAPLRRRRRRLTVAFNLAAISIVVIAGTAIAYPRTEYDKRGCVVDRLPSRAVFHIIDQTDPFTEDQLALFSASVQHHKEMLDAGDLFSLFSLQRNADGRPLTENFNRCRPLRGNDVCIWIDNPEKREKAYQAQFVEPLKSALELALKSGKSDTTPLLEALHAIAQDPAFENGGQGRTIVLYTDGLQKSKLASFFKPGYSYEELEQQKTVYLSGLYERFAGACVEMYITSYNYRQQTHWPEIETFWKDYWKATGVNCLTFKRI